MSLKFTQSCITLELLRESRPSVVNPLKQGPGVSIDDWLVVIGCQGAWNLWIEMTKRHVGGVGAAVWKRIWDICAEEDPCNLRSMAFQSRFNQVEIKRPPQKVDRSFKQSLQEQSGASQNFDERVEYDQDWYGGGNCRQVRKIYWQRLVVQKRWRMRFWHLEQG